MGSGAFAQRRAGRGQDRVVLQAVRPRVPVAGIVRSDAEVDPDREVDAETVAVAVDAVAADSDALALDQDAGIIDTALKAIVLPSPGFTPPTVRSLPMPTMPA